MLKFISKQVSRRGSGSGKADESGKKGPAISAPISFEFNEHNVARFSDLLEVTVRTKLSDQSGDPLSYVDDETTNNLVKDFGNGKVSKADFESYSASALWSAALQIINMYEKVLSSLKCDALKNATYDDVVVLAGGLSLPCQKLLGIIFAATEMLIRDEPSCAPMVLNQLANTIVWSLPPSTSATTNALVNLLIEHRKLFPACHTFARKISTTFKAVEPEEWRALAANSVSIYCSSSDMDTSNPPSQQTGATSVAGGVLPMEAAPSSAATSADSTVNQQRSSGGGAASSNHTQQPTGAGAETDSKDTDTTTKGSSAGQSTKPWRSAFTEDLPLNDLNASISIDVSARLAEQRTNNNNNGNKGGPADASAGVKGGGIAEPATNTSNTSTRGNSGESNKNTITIKGLQEVFSSALVSAASLDYLSISSIMDEDYADTRTLGGTIKWILHSQELSDLVTKSRERGANKGIISWTDFTQLAEPFLSAPEVAYLNNNKTSYDTPLPAAATSSGVDSSGTTSPRAEFKSAEWTSAGNARNTAGLAKKDSRSRSRKGFRDLEDSDKSESDSDGGRARGRDSKGLPATAAPKVSTTTGTSSSQFKQPASYSTSGSGGDVSNQQQHHHDHDTSLLSDQLSEVDEVDLLQVPHITGRPTTTSTVRGINSRQRSTSSDNSSSSSSGDDDGDRSAGRGATRGNIDTNKQQEQKQQSRHQWKTVSEAGAAKNHLNKNNNNKGKGGGSVFDVDLLDESVASIPLMNDRSNSSGFSEDEEERDQGKGRGQILGQSQGPGWGQPERNSFDDDDDDEDTQSDSRERGGAGGGKAGRDGTGGDSGKSTDAEQELEQELEENLPPGAPQPAASRHIPTYAAASSAVSTAQQQMQKQPTSAALQGQNVSLLTNSFDESDDDEHQAGSERHSVGTAVSDVHDSSAVDTSGLSINKKGKGKVHKMMKMFHLTSTSASGSVAGSSVNGSPQRSRKDSVESLHSAVSDANSVQSGGTRNTEDGGASASGSVSGKKKSVFGRLKSSIVGSKHKHPVEEPPAVGGVGGGGAQGSASAGTKNSSGVHPALSAGVGGSADGTLQRSRKDSVDSVVSDVSSVQSGGAEGSASGSVKGKKKSVFGRLKSSIVGSKHKHPVEVPPAVAAGSGAGAGGGDSIAGGVLQNARASVDSSLSAPSVGNSAGNSGRYSIGIADTSEALSAADSAVSLSQAPAPSIGLAAPALSTTPRARTGVSGAGSERSIFSAQITDTVSDDGSVASEQSRTTIDTMNTGGSASKKKKKSLKGIISKSFKAVFRSSGSGGAAAAAGSGGASTSSSSAHDHFGAGEEGKHPEAAGKLNTSGTGNTTAAAAAAHRPSAAALGAAVDAPNTAAAATTASTVTHGSAAAATATTPTVPLKPAKLGAAPPPPVVMHQSQGASTFAVTAPLVTSLVPQLQVPLQQQQQQHGGVANSSSGSTGARASPPKPPRKPSLQHGAGSAPSTIGAGSSSSAGEVGEETQNHGTHDRHPHIHHNLPAPTGPSIYQPLSTTSSAEQGQGNSHAEAPTGVAAAPTSSTTALTTASDTVPVGASQTAAGAPTSAPTTSGDSNVIAAERRLSNPALKRSSFKLSSLLAFAGLSSKTSSKAGGSNSNSRDGSRANSRSNSFSGFENASIATAGAGAIEGVAVEGAGGSGGEAMQGDNMNVSVSPPTQTAVTRPPSFSRESSLGGGASASAAHPPRNRNGLGLAALLRSTLVPAGASDGSECASSNFNNSGSSSRHSPPQSPTKRRKSPEEGVSTASEESLAAGASSMQLRYNALLARSRGMTAELFSRQQNSQTSQNSHGDIASTATVSNNIANDMERIKQSRTSSHRTGSAHSKSSLSPDRRKHHHHHHHHHGSEGGDEHSPAQDRFRQKELLHEWQAIVQRRAPLSLHMSAEEVAQLRTLVSHNLAASNRDKQAAGGGGASAWDGSAPMSPQEDRAHKQLKRQMSQVADPLFGLAIHDSAQTCRLSRVTEHPGSSSSGSSSSSINNRASMRVGGDSSVPGVGVGAGVGMLVAGAARTASTATRAAAKEGTCSLSPAEIDRIIAEHRFYSELDLALGTKHAGPLQRVSARMWRSRYFVLLVEPQINPNLLLLPRIPSPAPPSDKAALPHYTAGVSAPASASVAGADVAASETGTDAALPTTSSSSSFGYYLMEYSKGVASQWGTVPVKLLKRYPLRNIVSLRTDSRPSRRGLEFTIVLQREQEEPSAVVGTAAADLPHTGAPNPATLRTMQSTGSSRFASVVAQKQQQHKQEQTHNQKAGTAGIVGIAEASNTAASTAAAPSPAHPVLHAGAGVGGGGGGGASTAADGGVSSSLPAAPPTAAEDATSSAVAGAGEMPPTDSPAVGGGGSADLPVIKTRWNRLFQRPSTAGAAAVTAGDNSGAAAVTGTEAPPSTPAAADQALPAGTSGASGATAAAAAAGGSSTQEATAGPGDSSESEDEASEDGDAGEHEEVASSVADFESQVGEGDYFYRQGTFDGKNGASGSGADKGGRVDKKQFIKLRLKASSADERLLWVQIIHSVASPTMYSNTLSY